MNKWIYTTTPHVCLHGVKGDLTFTCKLRKLTFQAKILTLLGVRTVDIIPRSFKSP